MKRILLVGLAVLLVGGLAFAKSVVVPITPTDLKDLKGSWTGERFSPRGQLRTDLTINNDSIPLEGEISLVLPLAMGSAQTYPVKGLIEDGRLKLSWGTQTGSADLSLFKKDDGSMELRGTISGAGGSSPIVFTRIK